jgi:hypothetical protein
MPEISVTHHETSVTEACPAVLAAQAKFGYGMLAGGNGSYSMCAPSL